MFVVAAMHVTRVIFVLKHFRLPIVQGSTFSYLIPTIAILSLPEYKCPKEMESGMFNNLFYMHEIFFLHITMQIKYEAHVLPVI